MEDTSVILYVEKRAHEVVVPEDMVGVDVSWFVYREGRTYLLRGRPPLPWFITTSTI